MASYIAFSCDNGKNITSLQHFGLAYQNETCTGLGIEKAVRTNDRCTIGTMDDAQAEYNLE
jgi:hypothetical protein